VPVTNLVTKTLTQEAQTTVSLVTETRSDVQTVTQTLTGGTGEQIVVSYWSQLTWSSGHHNSSASHQDNHPDATR
jgi:hypothetical protein